MKSIGRTAQRLMAWSDCAFSSGAAVPSQILVRRRDAVIEQLSEDFAEAEIETSAANGKLLSYLGAHAEIHCQDFEDNRVRMRCHLPRHSLR